VVPKGEQRSAYGTEGGTESCMQSSGLGNLKERGRLEALSSVQIKVLHCDQKAQIG